MPDKNISFIVDEWRFVPNEGQIQFVNAEITIDNRLTKLLEFFCTNPGLTHTRDELIEHVWGGTVLTDQAVTQAVFELRKLLKKHSKQGCSYIVTVTKRGYRFDGEVKIEKLALQKPESQTPSSTESTAKKQIKLIPEKESIKSIKSQTVIVVLSVVVVLLASLLLLPREEHSRTGVQGHKHLAHYEFRYAVLNVSDEVFNTPELYGLVIKLVEHIGFYSNIRVVKSEEHRKLAAIELNISTVPSRDGKKQRLQVQYHNRVSDQTHLNRRYSTNFARFHETFPAIIDDLLRAMYIKVPEEELEQNVSVFPEEPEAVKALMTATGVTYNKANFKGAVEYFRKAQQLAPDNAYTVAVGYISEVMAVFASGKENQETLIEDLNQEYSLQLATILEKDNNPRVCEAYAILALSEGKPEKASQVLLSIPYNQQTSLTYLLLAKTEEALGHTDGAKELYLQATQNTSSAAALELAGPLFFDSNLDNLIQQLKLRKEHQD
ncbi:transcriptional activator of cad operon [Vibrio ishigakensis]|uniref:Transcriptional activator of cad operon n=1 Tax=Vibrio ishigakensis TaxID=1481914 RepID=A0A0B8P7F0_9VIBR|nr:transcriptional activator of cad operon [Vibrio ishigakensis]